MEQDEVKTWFKQQMTRAKKFQPLAVLNQKLRGLEVFEANDDRPTPAMVASHSRQTSAVTAPTTAVVPQASELAADPDEVVTQTHWQRSTGFDACSDPLCGKRLGGSTGQVNCRSCGKLFCEEHTMYQMKLSRAALHEPTRGLWCRVCETCYKSRDGYNDHTGLSRNHFDFFNATRKKTVDKQNLEVSRLETRLTRLTQLLANPPPEPAQSAGNYLWSSISGNKPQLRSLEQSIVSWEEDTSVSECPFCQQSFTQYTFRRHHCRVCGRVVCGDPATSCSNEIGLDVATGKLTLYFTSLCGANRGQRLTPRQKNPELRWRSMFVCAKTAKGLSSARRISREHCQHRLPINEHSQTLCNSSREFVFCCQGSSACSSPFRIQKTRPLQLNWPRHRKFGKGSQTPLLNMTLRLAESAISQPQAQPRHDYRKQCTSKQQAFSTYTCFL